MRWPDWVLLASLLVVAGLLRFGALDRAELWNDEAYSVRIGTVSVSGTIESLSRDNKPPLYPFLLHVWFAALGDSELALRSLSAVCGVLAVVVVWWLGFPLVSRGVARTAALVLTLHPLAVHYSREGRNYSLLVLLTLLVILSLPRAMETGRRRWWTVYSLSLSAALMTQYLAVVLIPVSLVQVASKRSEGNLRRWMLGTGLAFLPLLLWLPWVGRQHEFVATSLAWLQPFWDGWGLLEPFALSFVLLTPGGAAPPWVGMPWSAAAQPLAVAAGLAVLASFFVPPKEEASPWLLRIVIFGAIAIPLVILWAASHATFPIYIVGRADMIALPAFVLLIAVAIASARNRIVSITVALIVAASTLAGLTTYVTTPPINSESPALRPLAAALQPGDLVVCTGLTRLTAEYAVRRSGSEGVRLASFPGEMALHPAIYDPRSWTPDYLEGESEAVDDLLRDTLRAGRNAFVLMADVDGTQALREKLNAAYLTRSVARYNLKRLGTPVRVIQVSRRNP